MTGMLNIADIFQEIIDTFDDGALAYPIICSAIGKSSAF